MHSILKDFTEIYSNKINRIAAEGLENNEETLQRKVDVLEAWVHDVNEQNEALVETVEELEREAAQRVTFLQEKIDKMGVITRDSSAALKDHQVEVNSILMQKSVALDEADSLRKKVLAVETENVLLRQENSELLRDLDNLGAFIARAQMTGRWERDDEDNFGYSIPSDNYDNKSECRSSMELQPITPESRRKSSISSQTQISFSQESDKGKEDLIQNLQDEIQSLKTAQMASDKEILQRDKHIVDLQSQLTDVDHQLSVSQSTVDDLYCITATAEKRDFNNKECLASEHRIRSGKLHEALHQFRRESLNADLSTRTNTESELSENIDMMAARILEYDEEFNELQDLYFRLKTEHETCPSTITKLRLQQDETQKNIEIMRSVLTTEVADRYDQIAVLKQQLETCGDEHQNTTQQLHSNQQTIDQLRQQINALEAGAVNSSNGQSANQVIDFSVKISKLENEIAEKNILIRELQTHLSSTRHELSLKDVVVNKVEIKLDSARSSLDDRDERLNYLTGQLTHLQLEVSKLYGQTSQLTKQMGKQSDLIKKLEHENTSLTCQLNNKSSQMELKERGNHKLFPNRLRKEYQREELVTEATEGPKHELSTDAAVSPSLQSVVHPILTSCKHNLTANSSNNSVCLLNGADNGLLCASTPCDTKANGCRTLSPSQPPHAHHPIPITNGLVGKVHHV